MRLLTILLVLLLFSCGCRHREKDIEVPPLKQLQDKSDYYCSQDIDPYKFVDRCDGLTFLGMFDAYCKQIDIYKHEYTITYRAEATPPYQTSDIKKKQYGTGQWHRSILPCYQFRLHPEDYPEDSDKGDSRAETSFETELGSMGSLWHRGDLGGLKRKLTRAKAYDWIMGEGPKEYTHLNELSFLLKKMIEKLEASALMFSEGSRLAYDEEDSKTVLDKLKGYRGKVIAYYLAIKGEVYGYLNTYEMELLELCLSKDPGNPIYHILYGIYGKDEQHHIDIAIDILLDEEVFPSDRLPGHLKQIDWGDELGQALYAWMVHLLTHRAR